MVYIFRTSEKLKARSIILKNFTTVAKLLFLLNAVNQIYILGVVKRNPLFLHEIEWKNNGFLFTTPNIYGKKYILFPRFRLQLMIKS